MNTSRETVLSTGLFNFRIFQCNFSTGILYTQLQYEKRQRLSLSEF
jgi:hypothetical protein